MPLTKLRAMYCKPIALNRRRAFKGALVPPTMLPWAGAVGDNPVFAADTAVSSWFGRRQRALCRGGSLAEAEAEYRETILEWQHLGQRGAVANYLESFGYLASGRGGPRRAAVLLGAAERLREEAGAGMLAIERAEYDSRLTLVRESLDTADFERAWAEGRAMSTDDAVTLARSVVGQFQDAGRESRD